MALLRTYVDIVLLKKTVYCEFLGTVPVGARKPTTFFGKVFSLQYVLVTPLKIFGGMSKFGIYVMMKSKLKFKKMHGP
jgi:hypothetical protein